MKIMNYITNEMAKGVSFEYTNYDGICFTSTQSNAMTSMNTSPYLIMRFS